MKRCTKCMSEMNDSQQTCQNCGFVQGEWTQPSNALQRNTILKGRYLIGNVIGQGGFGITYAGFDLMLEMKVAVKEYFPSGSAMRTAGSSSQVQWDMTSGERQKWMDGLERFLKEAKKMAKLDSVPAIVRVRDAFRDNQTAYIVMDFVEGDTLKNYLLRCGVMRYQDCMRLLSPVLNSLAVMHDSGFIHRDISPDNIMIQPDGTARLLDMGAAVDMKASGGHVSMAVVKRNFSAPEQYLESETVGSWTDVYGMAATVYYCLTGKTVPEAMERQFRYIPLSFDPRLQIPPQAVSALNAALELDTAKRVKNMREFQRMLLSVQQGQTGPDGTGNWNAAPVSNYGSRTANPDKKRKGKAGGQAVSLETKPVAAGVAFLILAAVYVACIGIASWFNARIGFQVISTYGLTIGAGISMAVFHFYKKQGDSRKGVRGLCICLVISLMGFLPALAFAVMYEKYPQLQRMKELGEAVSWKQKLLFAVCAIVFAVVLVLTVIGLAELLMQN